jgi:trimeric autotransporter adhesin
MSITVTANGQTSVSTPAGIPVQLTATANYSDGTSADVTDRVIWSSSDNTIGAVTQVGPGGTGGFVSTLKTGNIQITAILGGISGGSPLQ